MSKTLFMRKIIITLITLFCISVGAKADPNIDAFTATNQVTTDGKLLISATDATTVNFRVTVSRPLVGGTTSYEGVSMELYIILNINGAEEVLGGPYQIGTSDFSGGSTTAKNYSVSIGAGKEGEVYLNYSYTNVNTGSYVGPYRSTGHYLTTTSGTLPSSSQNALNGYLILPNSGQVFWCFENIYRHVESYETLTGLYKQNYERYILRQTTEPQPQGIPLGPNNGLLLLVPTGEVYFLEGNLIRHITSPAVFDKYHFNWDALNWPQSRVYSISQYQLGTPIY